MAYCSLLQNTTPDATETFPSSKRTVELVTLNPYLEKVLSIQDRPMPCEDDSPSRTLVHEWPFQPKCRLRGKEREYGKLAEKGLNASQNME
jgi:hypothetical protein